LEFKLTPLEECLKKYEKALLKRDLSKKPIDALLYEIGHVRHKITSAPSKADVARAYIWYLCKELSIRGVAPKFRNELGPVPTRATSYLKAIDKNDAPYIDLLWLSIKYPDHPLPKRWSAVKTIANIPTSSIISSECKAFSAADKIISRKLNIPRKCNLLKFSDTQKTGMRYFTTREQKKRHRLVLANEKAVKTSLKNNSKKIKQITSENIERRLVYWRAWVLSGASDSWQSAADIYNQITGESLSRQGMRNMILRLLTNKAITRRGKKKTIKPAIDGL